MVGGAAKHWQRCQGREFTGTFDDCFNDYLPILELAAPILSLLLVYPFGRFAFSLLAPDPDERRLRWRLATRSNSEDLFPLVHAIAILGCVWALWRSLTYAFAIELWPYVVFWLIFSLWFGLAAFLAWPRPKP